MITSHSQCLKRFDHKFPVGSQYAGEPLGAGVLLRCFSAGKGLGRAENGISEAIKVKVKCDKGGVSDILRFTGYTG